MTTIDQRRTFLHLLSQALMHLEHARDELKDAEDYTERLAEETELGIWLEQISDMLEEAGARVTAAAQELVTR